MMVNWQAFIVVVVAAIVAACLLVTLFSTALRVGDGAAPWRRLVAVSLYVLCGLVVCFGLYLIVPALHGG
ncbi:MAG: hypothetical protein ABJA94_00600 [Rhodoglobus sp.]